MLPNQIKIIIADDHKIVRNGLKAMLLGKHNFFVAAEADNGKTCIALVEKIKPDILLLDIDMPDMTGIEVAENLAKSLPCTRIVMLTALDDKEKIVASVKAGASGFLSKNCDSKELINAIEKVASGENYFSKTITGDVFNAFVSNIQHGTPQTNNKLTDREIEVIKLLADGKRTKEIAAELDISPRTVECHKNTILEKLEVSSIIEVVRYAIRNKIIQP